MARDKGELLTELMGTVAHEVHHYNEKKGIELQDLYVTLLLLAINGLRQIDYPQGNLALLAAAMVYDQPLPTFN
jgi:uncharacterized protein YjaZ